MENQSKPSLKDNLNSIYELLYQPNLDNTMTELLSYYMDAYNQMLDNYQNNPSDENKQQLNALSGPVNYVLSHFPDDDNQIPYPAVDFIKMHLGTHGMAQDKAYTRSLSPSIPKLLSDDNDRQINGFSYAIIVIFITIILGIGLALLLLFIQ